MALAWERKHQKVMDTTKLKISANLHEMFHAALINIPGKVLQKLSLEEVTGILNITDAGFQGTNRWVYSLAQTGAMY